MPSTHGPFILPDGRHLAQALKAADTESQAGDYGRGRKASKTTKRGKDLQFAQVVNQFARLSAAAASGAALSATDVAELRALEAAGVRRRRRWLNDRLLRDMSGPLTMADMEKLFKPVPFGFRSESALETVAKPQHNHLWEGFRNIDPDKQARVLERWEEHNREAEAADRQEVVANPATTALHRWNAVSKKAKTALRKANVHSVLALEAQMLEFLELGTNRALSFPGLDGWGRLLVHGLADFYDLGSSTTLPTYLEEEENAVAVAVMPPTTSAASADQAQAQATSSHAPNISGDASAQEGGQESGDTTPSTTSRQDTGVSFSSAVMCLDEHMDATGEASGAAAGVSASVQATCGDDEGGSGQSLNEEDLQPAITVWHHRRKEVAPTSPPSITCTDILMALSEAKTGSLSVSQLQDFVRHHIHGSEAGRSDAEWVVV